METKLNVVILSHTPEFEQNIVRGARLCYSSADIEELRDQITPESAERFFKYDFRNRPWFHFRA